MQEHLGRCAEQLRNAVRHLAHSSGSSQEKLKGMFDDTGFGRIYEGDFPVGSLRNEYLTIRASLIKTSGPHVVGNVAATSDEQARKVIEQICGLSQAVAYALGRQSNSA
jgi:hypothetical protein